VDLPTCPKGKASLARLNDHVVTAFLGAARRRRFDFLGPRGNPFARAFPRGGPRRGQGAACALHAERSPVANRELLISKA